MDKKSIDLFFRTVGIVTVILVVALAMSRTYMAPHGVSTQSPTLLESVLSALGSTKE